MQFYMPEEIEGNRRSAGVFSRPCPHGRLVFWSSSASFIPVNELQKAEQAWRNQASLS